MAILSVNAGSSSLKFALYPLVDGQVQPVVLTGAAEGLEPGGKPFVKWRYQDQSRQVDLEPGAGGSMEAALAWLRALLATTPGLPQLEAVAHRVVHGGSIWQHSIVVSPESLRQMESLNSLAPLHQPHNIAGIRCFMQAFPQVPQIACFDTVFHSTIPDVDHSFALPQDLAAAGVRRYGFHGLSYQYIMSALKKHSTRAAGRVLMAHLGNGASLCAATSGNSCASTMGFSALDGLIMGTRSGSLDAGVLLYLLEQGWDHARIQKLLYKQSGLLGVSGISADMRLLRASDKPAAARAIEMFVHRIVREAGAMVACMGGIDLLAFSGGIGERDTKTRLEVCQKLVWMGVRIDEALNSAADGSKITPVHAPESAVEIWVVPTDEGLVSAREAAGLLITA